MEGADSTFSDYLLRAQTVFAAVKFLKQSNHHLNT